MNAYVIRMGQIIALVLGLIACVFNLVGVLPLLGIVNWLGLPFSLLGILVGHMSNSESKWGRNFCIVAAIWAGFRLFLGGGLL